ncbi:FadR family transcriptional regulator [Candidatus Bipolaricaulota bacterium]|nr:FadR family transcriptional regulator [Candidatus Bipolaricaulota bacterium]MBS3791022.1 FadR family transcriptional regulator [Candidatus Bipolaricaulota bacterium]
MGFEKVEEEKKVFIKVSEQILRSIIEGNYEIGDRLPPERELSKQMGVSRNSIREALGTLQALNIVSSHAGSGTYIENLPDSKELEALILPVIEEGENPTVVFEARKVFEPGVIEQAIHSLEDRDFGVLRQILTDMENLLDSGNYEEAYEVNARFHLYIANAVENPIVRNSMSSLWKQTHNELLREAVANYWKDNKEKANELHWQLLDAMERKDVKASKKIVRQHYEGPRKFFLNNYDGDE